MIKVLQSYNISPLLRYYLEFEKEMVWTEHGSKRQTGIQYKPGEDPWTSAVGRSIIGSGLAYTELNPFFKDTIVEDIVTKFNLLKARFLWVGPMTCYSMHRDESPRIHIPIITNTQCYFVFKGNDTSIIQHMPAGSVYWTNTMETHTFMNCSERPRLHLVGAVSE